MRLIDADALKRNFEANVPAFAQDMVPGICYIIDRARTIDAVPVIRCKDCKHCIEDKGDLVSVKVCELNHNKVQPDDWFCADGEREKDE